MQLSSAPKSKTLGEIIKDAIRPKPRRTQEQLAQAAGVSRWHLTKIINGYNLHMTVEQYEALRKALGLSRPTMDGALAASKEALRIRPVPNKYHKGLAARGMGKKP